jgi:hypothetical protein
MTDEPRALLEAGRRAEACPSQRQVGAAAAMSESERVRKHV